ncbi:uncharacterized protein [Miscanthus floridulus]|uniref:uncharacterized protein n=1 Tax=Miscanthus floridulus TaxID=154761 RepID=UPI00345AB769
MDEVAALPFPVPAAVGDRPVAAVVEGRRRPRWWGGAGDSGQSHASSLDPGRGRDGAGEDQSTQQIDEAEAQPAHPNPNPIPIAPDPNPIRRISIAPLPPQLRHAAASSPARHSSLLPAAVPPAHRVPAAPPRPRPLPRLDRLARTAAATPDWPARTAATTPDQ